MIDLIADGMTIRFPQVHANAVARVDFVSRLRAPLDDQTCMLPPGFLHFPLERMPDAAPQASGQGPAHLRTMFPMYQSHALRITFGVSGYADGVGFPFAIQVAAGSINAATGQAWAEGLSASPQNYFVTPGQVGVDGCRVRQDWVRQFTAKPLGHDTAADAYDLHADNPHAIRLTVYPMRRERYLDLLAAERRRRVLNPHSTGRPGGCVDIFHYARSASNGLLMQEIYTDPYGPEIWDTAQAERCEVHMLNSAQWRQVTDKPITTFREAAGFYSDLGLPWSAHFDEVAINPKG